MTAISVFLYDIFIIFYKWGIYIASAWNNKAKLWIEGRKNLLRKIEGDFKTVKPQTERIWMHCASLGEFEQGRTLIESLRQQKPEAKIILTFFSPSGYEVRKNYPSADYIYYLPIDTAKNAKRFLALIQPSIIIFVKYEFWYHYFMEAEKSGTKFILISGVFRKTQPFFKWYGSIYCKMLASLSHVFVQDQWSLTLLNELGFHNISIAGDTRIDRVAEIAVQEINIPEIEAFLEGDKAFIGGSIYEIENNFIHKAFTDQLIEGKIILAPHNTEPANIQKIMVVWNGEAVLFSEFKNHQTFGKQILIIDSIGLLSRLYKYGSIALIGGGFGAGIHNTLEPAAFGIPIIFGPRYNKFIEARDMVASGAAFGFENEDGLYEILENLKNGAFAINSGEQAGFFIEANKGGTQKIINWLNNRY